MMDLAQNINLLINMLYVVGKVSDDDNRHYI